MATPDATEIDVDGRVDETRDIRYLGCARRQADGTWTCLAVINGALCRVELSVEPVERGA